MKTNEFIKRVEELGYDIKLRNDYIQIIRDEFVAVVVYINVMYSITFHQIIKNSWNNGDKLFDLIVEYAKTPVDEREEEKKFYLRHRWFKPSPLIKNYLNYWIGNEEYWLDYKNESEDVKTQFTLKEVDEIKEKFNTDLADFEMIEVEE